MAMDSIELAQRDTGLSPIPANVNRLSLDSSSNEAADVQHEQAEFSLPPADKGKQAWLFLAACWAVEALVFGEQSFHLPSLRFNSLLFVLFD